MQFLGDGGGEVLEYFLPVSLARCDVVLYLGVGFGVLVFETEVFEFGLDGKEAETVGQRRVDVERFAGNFVLFAGQHRAQGAHVVQTVGHLHQNDTDIFRHRKQQLPEILGLCRSLVAKDTSRYFGQPRYNHGDFLAEEVLDVFDGIFGVFDHVVQEGRTDGGRAQSHLLTYDSCYGDGVHDIGLSRSPPNTVMGIFGKSEGSFYDIYLFPVVGVEIFDKQGLKFPLYHGIFFGFARVSCRVGAGRRRFFPVEGVALCCRGNGRLTACCSCQGSLCRGRNRGLLLVVHRFAHRKKGDLSMFLYRIISKVCARC